MQNYCTGVPFTFTPSRKILFFYTTCKIKIRRKAKTIVKSVFSNKIILYKGINKIFFVHLQNK